MILLVGSPDSWKCLPNDLFFQQDIKHYYIYASLPGAELQIQDFGLGGALAGSLRMEVPQRAPGAEPQTPVWSGSKAPRSLKNIYIMRLKNHL